MRGRKPIPSHMRLVRGNPGKRAPMSELRPHPVEAIPEPPAFLLEEAKAEWRRVAPELVELGSLTTLDLRPFAVYCQACGRAEQARSVSSPRAAVL
jgi:phage terminase small subunit